MMLAPKVTARIELDHSYFTRISSDARGHRVVERIPIESIPSLEPSLDGRLRAALVCLTLAFAVFVALVALS
jgi:hypothetical protein